MDILTLHRNADRVASIFNGLSIFVVVVGVLTAVAALIAGFVVGLQDDDSLLVAIVGAVVSAVVIGVYTAITWAGVQLAAVVAGYVKVRTGPDAPRG